MNTYLIALGSNLGDRKYYIEEAIHRIESHCGKVLQVAKTLESAPIGDQADQVFFNTALTLESSLSPRELLTILLRLEKELGRERSVRWGNRTIDLDIILWNKEDKPCTYQDEALTIPHPEALNRGFVMEPSAAVAGHWQHPLDGRTIASIWAEFA